MLYIAGTDPRQRSLPCNEVTPPGTACMSMPPLICGSAHATLRAAMHLHFIARIGHSCTHVFLRQSEKEGRKGQYEHDLCEEANAPKARSWMHTPAFHRSQGLAHGAAAFPRFTLSTADVSLLLAHRAVSPAGTAAGHRVTFNLAAHHSLRNSASVPREQWSEWGDKGRIQCLCNCLLDDVGI